MKVRFATAFALLLVPAAAQALNRLADPVVLTGASIPSLVGIAPADLVAFRYDGGWQQIPVQVDERAVVDFRVAMNWGTGGLQRLDYTDAGAFTGPDPNPALDSDDEIVFMAADAGQEAATSSPPSGVIACTGIEAMISDPLGSAPAYVYLFRQDGSLDPSAGQHYVNYQFNLLSGEYKATYNTAVGPNAEDTTATTPYYEVHFEDRWMQDGLRILAGSATGVDILDMHNNMFAPGNCGRTVLTFCQGEGAFIANKAGPVRAIRSYIGANSGPWTQRQHIYYAQREDITTFLRVHAIPGVMDFMDYSPDAIGMSYYNNSNLSGVLIDGVPDGVAAGAIEWELVQGAQGSLVIASRLDTDMPDPSHASYYLDDADPSVTQCTGDQYAYGSSGMWVNHSIPNTDPFVTPPVYRFEVAQTHYYGPPGLTVADAEQRKACAEDPLVPTFASWPVTVFADVGCSHWARLYIEAIYREGITNGCSETPLNYCPAGSITRGQMAVFVCKAAGKEPLNSATPRFSDVPKTHILYGWIERLADPDSWGGTPPTQGCTATEFCPAQATARGQMAAFLCRATGRTTLTPATPTFSDVPQTHPFYGWIERLADPGSWTAPPTTGCVAGPPRLYCPANACKRGEMAVFLCRAFNIPY